MRILFSTVHFMQCDLYTQQYLYLYITLEQQKDRSVDTSDVRPK